MKNSIFKFIGFLFLLNLFLSSCGATAKVEGSDEAITGQVAIQKLTPPEGKALVFVIRSSVVGSAIGMQVLIDGKDIGRTHGKRFLYAFVDPGKHTLLGDAENKSELPLVLESGKTYFIEQQAKMGILMARNKLIRLNETEGKKKLAKCKLAATNKTTAGL